MRARRAIDQWIVSAALVTVHPVAHRDPPADDGRSFCNHRAMSISNPVRLVLFDVDGTLVDHDGAAALGR
jgi:hypothetical protein